MKIAEIMFIVFGWTVVIGCIMTNAGPSTLNNSPELSQKYYDGCYYIVTPEGGITAKVNQPSTCGDSL